MSASFAVLTFGCRVNQADTLRLEGELRARGGCPAPPDRADVVVVNTCSVTAAADQGARQSIRRLVRLNPQVRVVVTGCYATRCGAEVAALPNVVRVVTNGDKDRLALLLAADGLPGDPRAGATTAERFGDGDGACGALLAPGDGGRTALTLRVQTGCEERCSYCIIPTTRGPGRSEPVAQVLRRIDLAVTAGYKEIVITGVHLGSYGRDLADGTSLDTLVRALAARHEDVLFRLSSLEPMDCTPPIVHSMASSPRLAPHFHLPLQHASDRMLAAMRRPYTFAGYADLVRRLRAAIPHASIGTDLIVGFPGERDEDVQMMCDRVAALPLSHLHVFPYSDRPGTQATAMTEKVPGALVRARARTIREIGAGLTSAFRAAQVGTVRRALTVDDGWSAVTGNYLKVTLDRQQSRNEWIDVRIVSADPLQGELVGA